jgi:hypothetical protein
MDYPNIICSYLRVITFENGANMAHVVENAAIQNTMLTTFHDINQQYARLEGRGVEKFVYPPGTKMEIHRINPITPL